MKITKINQIQEGEFFNKWMYNRLIKHNKNVLGVETGATGSGKSYRDLRKVQLWYKFHFKEDFPIENICFGVNAIMKRLNSGEMRRGEVLIFEEAGVNLGSLDFHNKVAKMFTYILQSFRSMNVAIFMNLPYESMLNKTARMLLHYTFESDGIDFGKKMNNCKPKFNQVNQSSGKVYRKYGRMKLNRRWIKIKRLSYSIPEKRLIDAYERQKQKYLADLTEEFTETLRKHEQELQDKMERDDLSDVENTVYHWTVKIGLNQTETAKKMNISQQAVGETIKRINRKHYNTNKPKIVRKNNKTKLVIPLKPHLT